LRFDAQIDRDRAAQPSTDPRTQPPEVARMPPDPQAGGDAGGDALSTIASTTTNVYLAAKIRERTSQGTVLRNMTSTAAEAGRDLTAEERKTFDGITERLVFLDDEIKRIIAAEKGAAAFVEVYGAHEAARAQADAARAAAARRAVVAPPEERRSIGQRFVESEQFKRYDGHGTSAAFTIDGPWLEERESFSWPVGTNIMASNSPDVLTPAMQWSGPRQPAERFPLLDVIGRVPTNAGSVEYWYFVPDPAVMASEVAEGAPKPEAVLGGEAMAAPISTYAWWKGLTRQALDDIPQIRGVVDGYLRQGVIRRISAEAGTALSSNTDFPTAGAAGQDLLAVIRVAMATVDQAGYPPNAVLLNPYDWAAFDVAFLGLNGGTGTVNNAFWGLRPVAVPGVPTGTAYVGDFREGITFFDRQSTQVFMTDSHTDYFIRNKMVILAEARGKVVVTNAAAIVKCTGGVPEIMLPFGGGEGIEGAAATRARTTRAAAPRT
jgi:hypothetical protein